MGGACENQARRKRKAEETQESRHDKNRELAAASPPKVASRTKKRALDVQDAQEHKQFRRSEEDL